MFLHVGDKQRHLGWHLRDSLYKWSQREIPDQDEKVKTSQWEKEEAIDSVHHGDKVSYKATIQTKAFPDGPCSFFILLSEEFSSSICQRTANGKQQSCPQHYLLLWYRNLTRQSMSEPATQFLVMITQRSRPRLAVSLQSGNHRGSYFWVQTVALQW